MRVTSPPKHHSQLQRVSSHLKNQSTLSNISNQTQRSFHQLKSPQKTGPYRAQNSAMKQSLYAELKNRELQYGQIISQLNKENNILKAQLGKNQPQQPKKASYTTIMSISPQKINFNRTIENYHSENLKNGNLANNRVMNQTFSGFHVQTVEPSAVVTIRPNLSPFSRKPAIQSHISPVGYRPGMVTVVSPNKRGERPLSNLVSVSNKIPISSPQKGHVHHSYQPSLISFKYPSQQQSLDCSPKKSFQTIIGLFDSQIFYDSSKSQYSPLLHSQENDKAMNSNFFDVKKRKVNYGSVFDKQKSASSSSKNIHTTLKISTKNWLQNQVEGKKSFEKERNEEQSNSSNTKRQKEVNLEQKAAVIQRQIPHQQKSKEFNLEQNIKKNPLLSIIKKRLQEEVNGLNALTDEPLIGYAESLFQQTPNNPFIRYSYQNQEPITQNCMIHPLKRNLFQSLPLLNQLKNSQNTQNDQLPQQVIEITENSHNQNTKGSLEQSNSKSQSRLSEKVQTQHKSELIIQQTQSQSKTMTIVRMLDQTKQNQSDQLAHANNSLQFIDQNNQEINQTTDSTDFICVNRESIQQQNQNHHFQSDQSDNQGGKQGQTQQHKENFMISNRYYCQNTEENQSIRCSSINQLYELEPQTLISKTSLKDQKKVLIDQSKSDSKQFPSTKTINSNSIEQRGKNKTQFNHIQTESEKVLESESSPSQFYCNTQKFGYQQAQQLQKLNKSAQYQAFYGNKKNKNCHVPNQNESKGSKEVQKYQASRISDAWSQNSLRSQRFKKISNRAYL